MKNRIARIVFRTMICAAVGFTGLVLTSREAGAKMMDCYRAADDQDRDGYARRGASTVRVQADETALKCPGSYIDKGADCNDFNSAVHPRTREIGYDGVDNNCNGLIDEPTYEYRADGVNNRARSFTMSIHLNNSRIRDAALAGRLWAKINNYRMHNSAALSRGYAFRVTQLTPGAYTAQMEVSGLEPGAVYVVRAYFFEMPAGTLDLNRLTPVRNPNVDDAPEDYIDMEQYFTMTDSDLPYMHNRFLMVMRALNETEASNHGEVGYMGTIAHDGTRYQADANRKWCTEFYVWAIRPWVEGVTGIDDHDELLDYFDDHNAKFSASEIPNALPGDYLALDSDLNGSINHSAMFLAYDNSATTPKYWTLEGNTGNVVKVRSDRPAEALKRLGKIRSAMWR